MLCGQPGDAPNLVNKANICRDEASRCLGNFFRAWRSLLRFLDLPVHQVTVVNLKAAGGRSISMHKRDRLVTDHLMKRR
jgi:hypothetical protein